MLTREDGGRGEESDLDATAPYSFVSGEGSNYGFAGADVALKQAIHRSGVL